jgi:putative membrane protein
MMYWNGHMTTAGWIIAVLWTVITFALIAGAVYWLVSALAGRGPRTTSGATGEASAREILDQRLAKGELTIEQYKELRDAIGDEAPLTRGEPLPSRPASAPG